MKIWCLFAVDNNYDQPPNNLVYWWQEKPSIEKLAKHLAQPLDRVRDEVLVNVIDIWRGKQTVLGTCETAYRLQEVAEGESP